MGFGGVFGGVSQKGKRLRKVENLSAEAQREKAARKQRGDTRGSRGRRRMRGARPPLPPAEPRVPGGIPKVASPAPRTGESPAAAERRPPPAWVSLKANWG